MEAGQAATGHIPTWSYLMCSSLTHGSRPGSHRSQHLATPRGGEPEEGEEGEAGGAAMLKQYAQDAQGKGRAVHVAHSKPEGAAPEAEPGEVEPGEVEPGEAACMMKLGLPVRLTW